eukprot:s169_g5.t1
MEGVDLGMTVPVFSHTDEGRSYKHEPLFVLSTHGCIGRGTRAYVQKKKHKVPLKRRGFGLNFIGSTWGTQFMSVAVLRAVLDEYPDALKMITSLYAQDMAKLIHEGVVGQDGTRVFFLHVATKGDLPALAKLGQFKRTHSHVPRQPRSKKPCVGVCHMCQAGVEEVGGRSLFPFEDVSDQPLWSTTVNAVPPWNNTPPLLSNLPVDPCQKPSFFKVDFWHNWHLGVSKHWLASSFVSLIERMNKFETGSVEGAFEHLTAEFAQFCSRKKMKPYMAEISRESMSFPTNRTCPVGRWSKGLVATQLMLFLQFFCEQRVVGKTADRASGTRAMNIAITYMYHFGYWLPSAHGMQLSRWLQAFLKAYGLNAKLCLHDALARFAMVPKVHFLAHAGWRLRWEAERSPWCVNPIAESNQLQEDFIGKPSRISRRVDIRQIHLRCVERSLICCKEALEASDMDNRGLQ